MECIAALPSPSSCEDVETRQRIMAVLTALKTTISLPPSSSSSSMTSTGHPAPEQPHCHTQHSGDNEMVCHHMHAHPHIIATSDTASNHCAIHTGILILVICGASSKPDINTVTITISQFGDDMPALHTRRHPESAARQLQEISQDCASVVAITSALPLVINSPHPLHCPHMCLSLVVTADRLRSLFNVQ